MKHNICVIDDSIPLNSNQTFIDITKQADSAILKYLIRNENWSDLNVKRLIKDVLRKKNHWSVTAFSNPRFYFNYCNENIISSEIIIFDWDYNGSSNGSKEYLINLLETTYSLIFIYTNEDYENEVTNTLNDDTFNKYEHRLDIIKKGDRNSVGTLLTLANEKYKENFSYRFNKELRNNVIKSIDEILIKMSKLSIDEFVALFGYKKGNKYIIPTIDLVSFITEKFKHQLLKHHFTNETQTVIDFKPTHDPEIIEKLWSYRLYHYPKDNVVRKGDIISKKRSNSSILYLVLSSDCHLEQFWNKNFGNITLVPLYKLDGKNDIIKEKFIANKSDKLKNFKLTSLTNPTNIEGITILPCIKDKEDKYNDYLLSTKEIISVKIKLPSINDIENKKNRLPLLYDYWKGYTGKSRFRISEPFLSPLVQFILDNVSGYGCPDFPEQFSNQIKKSFDEARK